VTSARVWKNGLPTLAELDRRLAEKSLFEFVRQAWPVLEPTNSFQPNWHVEAVCHHLEAVSSGAIRRLIINIPPGFMKSLATCVFWFCWTWLRQPASRWLYASYAEQFALRDSLKCRDLMRSGWYQGHWGSRYRIRRDQDTTSRFTNDAGGFRLATGVGGGGTGERVDYVIADDPHKIDEADSAAAREAVLRWWDQVISGRGTDPKTSRFVVIMQRLHEEDLTGHLLQLGGYEHLVIPMEFESARRCVTSLWQDPRSEEGQLAWPERFDTEAVTEWKKSLLAYGTAGQLQQRPAPKGAGGIFSSQHFRYFDEQVLADGQVVFVLYGRNADGTAAEPRLVRAGDCRWFQTVDTAMTTNQSSDYTVVGTFALTPQRDLLIVHVDRARIEMPLQYGYVIDCKRRWPAVAFQAIEDRVSGTGLLQQGRLNGTPFKPLVADGDKVRRATHIAIAYQNGTVYHKAGANWLADFESELTVFPKGGHDDQVDVLSYAGILVVTEGVLQQELNRDIVLWPPVRPPAYGLRIEDPDGDIITFNGHRIDLREEPNWWDSP
jgi:predicted phage terminase large subunit-like protein